MRGGRGGGGGSGVGSSVLVVSRTLTERFDWRVHAWVLFIMPN